MGDETLSAKGRAAFGAACVACCAVPMLVVAGVVSLGALVGGGVAVGSVVLVILSTLVVHGRWVGATSPWLRMAVGASGVALAGIGLAVLEESPGAGRSLLSGGVAVLACAGMLALAPADDRVSAAPAPPA